MAAATPSVSTTPLIALVGNPNCGKTALFNRLTGARQKVGNYAGVTVERKEGQFVSPAGQAWRLLDLPGAYSLLAATPDEAITRDVIAGVRAGESAPVGRVCVVDATNLRLNLRMVLELQTLDVPMVLVLNMMDQATKRGIHIDVARLQAELGIPVVEAVAVRSGGEQALLAALDQSGWARLPAPTQTRDMARMAATDFGADWVINNDADEFWWPTADADLKACLARVPDSTLALQVPRFNFPVTAQQPDGVLRHARRDARL